MPRLWTFSRDADDSIYNDLPVHQLFAVKRVVDKHVAEYGKPDECTLEQTHKTGVVSISVTTGNVTTECLIGPLGAVRRWQRRGPVK